MTQLKRNPHLIIVSRKPLFTEEESHLIYAATGFYPWHVDLEKLEARLEEGNEPESKLINSFFGYGEVMIFEHDIPFLGVRTQDFVNNIKSDLIDCIFVSNTGVATQAVTNFPDVYSVNDVRSLISLSKRLLGIEISEQRYGLDFFDYLRDKDFLSEQSIELIRHQGDNPELAAHQLFHDSYDDRVKYFFPSGVTLNPGFSDRENALSSFKKTMSQPVEGYLAFTKEQVKQIQSEGKSAIFVSQNINLEDISFIMESCEGLIICEEKDHGDAHLLDHLTGIPGLYFFQDFNGNILKVENKRLLYADKILEFGSFVVLDTGAGRLLTANASTATKQLYPQFSNQLVKQCDEHRRLKTQFKICVNMSHANDVSKIDDLDIDGIGLVRTEYFFLTLEKIACLKSAMVEPTLQAITDFQNYQKGDFSKLFNDLGQRKPEFFVTVRLLDPKPSELLNEIERNHLKDRLQLESDPRGVQIISAAPELYLAQSVSLFRAAQEQKFDGELSVLVPFVSSGKEMKFAREIIEEGLSKSGFKGTVRIGTMLETFEALANIESIVLYADFANIGPKDLTIEFLEGLCKHQHEEIREFLSSRYGDNENMPFYDKRPHEHLHSTIKAQIGEALEKARRIKPGFEVIVCGDEIYKSNPSLDFALRHTQGISVPINRKSIAETKFIISHHVLHLNL